MQIVRAAPVHSHHDLGNQEAVCKSNDNDNETIITESRPNVARLDYSAFFKPWYSLVVQLRKKTRLFTLLRRLAPYK